MEMHVLRWPKHAMADRHLAQLCTPVGDEQTAALLGVEMNVTPWSEAKLNRTTPIGSRKRTIEGDTPVGGGGATGRSELCPLWSENATLAEMQQMFFEGPIRVFDASKDGHCLADAEVPEGAANDLKTFGPLYV